MINKTLLVLVLCFPFLIVSQTNAITEYGDQVVLMDDGTWKYIDENSNAPVEIPVNETIFEKDKKAKFLLKSKVFNVGLWLNAKDWKFNKTRNDDDAEYELTLRGEDLYGSMITEKFQMPLETLKEIALSNAKDAAPDAVIDEQEYRTVNGIKVLMLKMSGTTSGIKFGYHGYYYSNEKGTVQLILFTAKSLMEQYKDKMDTLLNGFVEL